MPALPILTEDVLEQTSLACNTTAPFPSDWLPNIENNNGSNFASSIEVSCQINVAKGNSFAEFYSCENNVSVVVVLRAYPKTPAARQTMMAQAKCRNA